MGGNSSLESSENSGADSTKLEADVVVAGVLVTAPEARTCTALPLAAVTVSSAWESGSISM